MTISIDDLAALRAESPGAIADALASRTRPDSPLGPHGRVMIIAADHPARGMLGAGARGQAMVDRRELLRRLIAALERPGVTGVLGTPDVLDDLALLGALEGRFAVGSMNRGGLGGSCFEIDDRYTAYDASSLVRDRLDGGKLLLRIDPQDPATAGALESAAHAVSGLAGQGLMAMVEPFMSGRAQDRLRNDLSTEAVIRSVGISAALGTTSAHTWLKIPVVPEMERVAAATTLPILLLGGEVASDQDAAFDAWSRSLALPGVFGLVVGRSLLFPPDDDVVTAVDRAVELLENAATSTGLSG
jgi:hypothetical protein